MDSEIIGIGGPNNIGGERPYNLKQRLERQLFMSISIGIEAKEDRAVVQNFSINKKQLYIFKEIDKT